MHHEVGVSPCVSVLMTAYNSEKFIARAIDSIQNQTFKNFEFIIVDDDSKDSTFDLAKEIAGNDKRVRIYKNHKNVGDYANRIIAANYASGKYLKYLDSDNYLYPHGLDVLVSCMELYPEAGLGLCKLHEASHPLPDVLLPIDSYREIFFKSGLLTNAPSSAIITAKVYHSVGGFLNTRHRGDYELWLKLAAVSSVVRIPGLLDWTGIHPNQESNINAAYKAGITFNITVSSLYSSQCPLGKYEKKMALKLYKKKFFINTFIKRVISGEFGFKDLVEIYKLIRNLKK